MPNIGLNEIVVEHDKTQMTTARVPTLHLALRWTVNSLCAMQLLALPLWAIVLKGSATSARFAVINRTSQTLTFTPIVPALFSPIGFPALQTSNFRLGPGEAKTISYYCTGSGLAQLYFRAADGQAFQFTNGNMPDDCFTRPSNQPKEYIIGSLADLSPADPMSSEFVGQEPPSGIHLKVLFSYVILSLPFLLVVAYGLQRRLGQTAGRSDS